MNANIKKHFPKVCTDNNTTRLESTTCMVASETFPPAINKLLILKYDDESVAVASSENRTNRPIWIPREKVLRYNKALAAEIENLWKCNQMKEADRLLAQAPLWSPN